MSYGYKIHKADGSTVTGIGFTTLHEVIDHIEFYSYGKTLRDVSINGIDISEVGLHVFNGKVVEEDGKPIVCCNKWYDIFAKPSEPVDPLGRFHAFPATTNTPGESL